MPKPLTTVDFMLAIAPVTFCAGGGVAGGFGAVVDRDETPERASTPGPGVSGRSGDLPKPPATLFTGCSGLGIATKTEASREHRSSRSIRI